MEYYAIKKSRKGKLESVVREDNTPKNFNPSARNVKKFSKEDFYSALMWGKFNIHKYIENIMEKNGLDKAITERTEEKIRDKVTELATKWLLEHPRQKIIRDYDDVFEKAMHNDKAVKYSNAIVLERGPLKPLEFSTLGDFLREPSGEVETDFFSPDRVKFFLSIGDVIESELSPSVSADEILDGKQIDWTCDFFRFPEELYECSKLHEKLKSAVEAKIQDQAMLILTGKAGTLSKDDFFTVYEKGCRMLGVKPEYRMEYYASANTALEEKAFQKVSGLRDIRDLLKMKDAPTDGPLHEKGQKLQKTADDMVNTDTVCSENARTRFHDKASDLILNAKLELKKAKKGASPFQLDLEPLLRKLCMIEVNEYLDNEIRVNLSDLLATNDCIREFIEFGIVHVSMYSYIRFETKASIKELIPKSPELEYPQARDMKRHFIIHYGPTNSGKTHDALQKLMEAETGTYLGPLRLLALEVQDKLNDGGVPCSLLTGEEEDIVENAGHIASTVEKADMFNHFDVCVIDECQMISDEYRGFAWTRAILGIQAETIYLCMGPEAVNICKKLIEMCGDTYELVEHKRRSALQVEDGSKHFILSPDYIEEGDAIIVFSKKKVLQVAAELIQKGIKTSLIYGNLPYSVRKKQVERFLNHETDVVVSTDAIGMGINLPVRRIIFLEDEKFNGKTMNKLTVSEVKQIAGRAGRNRETGYVNSVKGPWFIKERLSEKTPETEKAFLGFSDEIISINADLGDILKVWKTIPTGKMFQRMDIDRLLALDQMVYVDVKKKDKLKMISIPFDEKNEYLLGIWLDFCRLYEKGKDLYIPQSPGKSLYHLEDYYKALDLYYSFSRNFGYRIDMAWLKAEKENVSDRINIALVNDLSKHQRRCRRCGRPLSWDHPFAICEECYYMGNMY